MPTQMTRKPMTRVMICTTGALRPWKSTIVVTIEKKVTAADTLAAMNIVPVCVLTDHVVCWCDCLKVSNILMVFMKLRDEPIADRSTA